MVGVIRVAAAIIMDGHGHVLIAKRKADAHLSGLWEFPGGKCEERETLEACLRRELREELSIEITTPAFWRFFSYSYSDRTIELFFYRCKIAEGTLQTLGCDEFRWVAPLDLNEYEFPPADRSVIDILIQQSL